MATFKNPPILSLCLATKTSLLIQGAFDPTGLPMDCIDMDDRQTKALVHFPSKRTFS
jgi:hypothetical protein